MSTQETWTHIHDLALVYIALAYGSDHRLTDDELTLLTQKLMLWGDDLSLADVQEVVLEAMTVYLEAPSQDEVLRSVKSLSRTLSTDSLRRALDDVMHIAEADGVLLHRERGLIGALADLWEVKATAEFLLQRTTALVPAHPGWSLLHDMCLVFIVLAHSTDNDLSEEEIGAIIERLWEWQPQLDEAAVRSIIAESLTYYASGPGQDVLENAVRNLREAFPALQRLALLDDLVRIAEADGVVDEHETEMIVALSRAWNVNVRFGGD
jgi:uncharacterized tellurite resistance protein B-like protein